MHRLTAVVLALVCLTFATAADARPKHARHRATVAVQCVPDNSGRQVCSGPIARIQRHARGSDANGNRTRAQMGSYVTVSTDAGIDIRAAAGFAGRAREVIAHLVAGGYQPKKIHCLNFSRSHVHGSYHFRGLACDVDQCGWGCSPVPRALMRAAVAAAGLRDGCEFRDHGHFDFGPHLDRRRVARNCGRSYADAVGSQSNRWASR